MSKQKEFTSWAIARSFTKNFQVIDVVKCGNCGGSKDAYRWSWAGHGYTQCPHCKLWFAYNPNGMSSAPNL